MRELATIDLEKLPLEALAEAANEAAEACERAGRKTVEHAIRCGRFLAAAKDRVGHGKWLGWLKANFDQSERHAQRYIDIASNTTRVADLENATTIREALRMIAETPEAQAKAADRAQRKLAAAPAAAEPAKQATPATLQRELDASAAPATTPVAMPQTVWQPEQSQEQERITTTAPTPREHESRAMTASATPTDRPGEWYDHWYYHPPTGGLEKLSHKDILTAAEHIGEPRPILEETLKIFGWEAALKCIMGMPPVGKPRIDLARKLQKAAEALLASEGKAPPKATVPLTATLISALNEHADVENWPMQLSDAATNWAAYKQALAPAERIRTLDSWTATLKRMTKLAETHGVAVVVEMIEKSIANGWTGWEHLDAVKRSPAAVKSGRKTNDDWGIQYETVEG